MALTTLASSGGTGGHRTSGISRGDEGPIAFIRCDRE